MSDNNVRLQNLRDFTVQIRRPSDDTIVGTGIVFSMDGVVVTCDHVVEAALGAHPREANGDEVGIYFPQARMDEEKSRRATVAAWFSQHDDDVVLLQLVGGPVPVGPEQIAILGTADLSEGNPFRSYGYCPLGPFPSARADGIIMGDVEAPVSCNVQADPVQLKSSEIAPGMSGAAVLDVERNLVVGLISETWFPDASTKHRDTAWAVNTRILTVDPFSLSLRDASLPKRPALEPKADVEMVQATVTPGLRVAWNNAPPSLQEWVGREDLLRAISGDWADQERQVTGLIGFGGEGKSSLARRWVEDLLADPSQSQPGAVFWWGFYTKPNVDEFFEAALKYLIGGRVDSRQFPSSSAKAHQIAALLYARPYLFVLDGLEVLQHQKGDQYGLLKSADLREFLSYFAASGHQSFCLITSRAPVLDLMEYTTYTRRDVTRLAPADGRALFQAIGINGPDSALDQVVADWDGHALTLSLLGGYLVERYGGDISSLGEIPSPVTDEPRYERVHRVLRRYDEYLTDAEQAFLTLFSAFRTPVHETAFTRVFRTKTDDSFLNVPLTALDDGAFDAIIRRLVTYRILHSDPDSKEYTVHPLIRAHYFTRLTRGSDARAQTAHEHIRDYYLLIAGDTPLDPVMEDLKPLIEVVYHACRAGAYDEAVRIFRDRIYQGRRKVLIFQLGAADTAYELLSGFFPGNDTLETPRVSAVGDKAWVLNELGLRLVDQGKPNEALPCYERSLAIVLDTHDWLGASSIYQDMAELYAYLGRLERSAAAAQQALKYARKAGNLAKERYSLARQAWTAHLRGEFDFAGKTYQQAEALERRIDPSTKYLYSLRGIQYAEHLRRIGDVDHARLITMENLRIVQGHGWTRNISQCHRLLADLDAQAGYLEGAQRNYARAVEIAKSISRKDAFIESLLARGRWCARKGDTVVALSDLNEALNDAVSGGFRLYETDIHVGLAWAHLAAGDPSAVRAEAEYARRMSAEMGYYWGQVDAEEVLAVLGQG